MAINKQKKIEIVDKLTELMDKAKTMVFVNFHGLTVAGVNTLRKNLRSKDVGYYVAKKTLIKRAFAKSSIAGEFPVLDGEVAVAFSEDPISSAKEIYEFQKKNAEVMKIIGGVFENKYMDGKLMLEIAKIPGREVLLGQFVNVINSPIQGLVIALDALAKKKEVAV